MVEGLYRVDGYAGSRAILGGMMLCLERVSESDWY